MTLGFVHGCLDFFVQRRRTVTGIEGVAIPPEEQKGIECHRHADDGEGRDAKKPESLGYPQRRLQRSARPAAELKTFSQRAPCTESHEARVARKQHRRKGVQNRPTWGTEGGDAEIDPSVYPVEKRVGEAYGSRDRQHITAEFVHPLQRVVRKLSG